MTGLARASLYLQRFFGRYSTNTLSLKAHITVKHYSTCIRHVQFSSQILQNQQPGFFNIARGVTTQGTFTPRRSLKADEDATGQRTVRSQLDALDIQVKRYGRVAASQVVDLLQDVEKNGKLSEHDSLMLIRCTGDLLKHEDSSSRMQLFNRVWDSLSHKDVIHSISHYNAALRVQIENKHPVSPTEFLSDLESKGIFPNRITYQLLIARYCEDGDIEGALKILEHMKAQHMAINETVFNALIKGYCKRNDFEAAEQVLTSMSDAGLDPSSDTFRIMACVHAASGNMAGVQEIIDRAATNETPFQAKHLLDVIVELTVAGHKDYVPQIFELLKGRQRYYIDASNAISTLLVQGHHQVAFDIFVNMEPADLNVENSRARMLVRSMIQANMPFPQVTHYLEQLAERGHGHVDVGTVLFFALQHGRPNLSIEALQEMRMRDEEIKPHFFWKIFRQFKAEKDIDGMYRGMKTVIDCLASQRECIGTLNKEAVTPLVDMGQSVDDVCNKLTEFGLTPQNANGLRLAQYIRQGSYAEAKQLISSSDIAYFPLLLKAMLLDCFQNKPDVTQYVELVAALGPVASGEASYIPSAALLNLANRNLSKEELEQIINDYSEKGLTIDQSHVDVLTRLMSSAGVSDQHLQKLQSLAVSSRPPRTQFPSTNELGNKNMEELEEIKTTNEKKGVRNLLVDKLLLGKYCQAGKVEQADELKTKLEGQGFVYVPDTLRQLGTLEGKHKENLEGAVKYRDMLENQYPEFFTYVSLQMQIAILQAKANKMEEVHATLQSYMDRHAARLDKSLYSEGFMLSEQCDNLMKAATESCDQPQQIKELGEKLFKLGYIKTGTFNILQSTMRAFLHKQDYDGALQLLEEYISVYGRAPMFSDLLNALIKNEDAARLQKAVDLLISMFGEMQVLHHLVVGFIDAGKVKQARKILDTPGIRAVNPILKRACEMYFMQNKVKEQENLVTVTKGLFALDRDEMLFNLMRIYAKNEELDKCLDVLATFEEESINPRGRTLRYLAKVLESKGRTVPFEVPSAEEEMQGVSRPAASPLEEEAWEAIKARDFNRVMQIKRQITDSGDMLSTAFLSGLAVNLLNKKESYVFKMLVHDLGQDGDVESLLHIRQHNLPTNMDNFLHQRLFYAYIMSGRSEELLDFLAENPVLLPKYSTTGAIKLLAEKYPQQFEKYESTVHDYFEQASVPHSDVFNHMFNYYTLNDQTDKAEKLLTHYPKFKERANLSYIVNEAKQLEKEELVLKMLDWFRTTQNPKPKLSYLYSALLTIKNGQGLWQESLSYYEQALADGLETDTLWARPLLQLEMMLEANNQTLPWPKGSIQAKATKQEISYDSGSSSDSDSSSDEEDATTKKDSSAKHFKR